MWMKKTALTLCCLPLLASSPLAADVETVGDLKTQGWIQSGSGFKFPDGSELTTSGLNGLLFNVGFVVDNSGSNTGTLNSGAIKFGSDISGEGIASQRTTGTGLNGLDFYTNYVSRLFIGNDGKVGIGTRTPSQALDVVGNLRVSGTVTPGSLAAGSVGSTAIANGSVTSSKLNIDANVNMRDKDLSFRGDVYHGLGWYGEGKRFAGANVDGPALYGNSGGALGTNASNVQKTALSWDSTGQVSVNRLKFANNTVQTTAIRIYPLSGPIQPSIPGGAPAYVFAGPTVSVTTAAGQHVTGTISAPLGTSSATPFYIDYGICFRPSGTSDAPINFVGNDYSVAALYPGRTVITAAASMVPQGGTWDVGFCVKNPEPYSIDDNDFLNGWLMVTD